MGGVNNLSTLNGIFAEPKYNNFDTLVRDLMIEFHTARNQVDILAKEVAVCDLIGLSFRNYNYGPESHAYPMHQQVLNNAVLKVNAYV